MRKDTPLRDLRKQYHAGDRSDQIRFEYARMIRINVLKMSQFMEASRSIQASISKKLEYEE